MVSLLAKLFIKDHENTASSDVRRRYGMLCSAVGIGLNILLFVGKYFAGSLSGSVAITADAFNNLSDAGSAITTLVGFKFAGAKPDSQHPFGHGRIEYIAGFGVSALILLMGAELTKISIEKIINPEPVEYSIISVWILIASVAVKLYMHRYNFTAGKIFRSETMKAIASDSISDAAATAVVLISMVFLKLTGINIDGYCGAIVSVFILYTGFTTAKETLSPLLGQPPESELVEKICGIVIDRKSVV